MEEEGLMSQNPVVLCPVGMKPGTHMGLCGPSIKKECFGEVPKKKKKRKLVQLIFRKKVDGRR